MLTSEIVGFNVSRFHNAELVLGTLEDAIDNSNVPEILHSDQGSEYESQEYVSLAESLGIKISMSKKQSPWENAHQESFYSQFKVELGATDRFENLGELIEEISRIILYYNPKRIPTSLKATPEEFKKRFQEMKDRSSRKLGA